MTNWTIERLTSLSPGERFAYYRGDLDTDIRRAGPPYCDVLTAVRDTANELSRAGRIDIEVTDLRTVGKPGSPAAIYQYVATGRRP